MIFAEIINNFTENNHYIKDVFLLTIISDNTAFGFVFYLFLIADIDLFP